MASLGYTRYGAQGGDWGSTITASLGSLDPQHCAGIHVTLAMNSRPNVTGEPTPEEARALAGIEFYREWDSGYATQQSTRPQTVAYGLTDSPAGQAAWILEKFWAWNDCNGHPENILSRDELLDLEWSCGRIREMPKPHRLGFWQGTWGQWHGRRWCRLARFLNCSNEHRKEMWGTTCPPIAQSMW
jgi:hypothetical protein